MGKIKNGIIFIIFIICVSFSLVYVHEQVHVQIFKYYGCGDVLVTYNIYGGQTNCLNYDNVGLEDYNEMRKLHSWNEIIGYPVTLFIVIFSMMMFMLIMKEKTVILYD